MDEHIKRIFVIEIERQAKFALTAIAHADSTRIARNFEPWNSRVLPYVVSSRNVQKAVVPSGDGAIMIK